MKRRTRSSDLRCPACREQDAHSKPLRFHAIRLLTLYMDVLSHQPSAHPNPTHTPPARPSNASLELLKITTPSPAPNTSRSVAVTTRTLSTVACNPPPKASHLS